MNKEEADNYVKDFYPFIFDITLEDIKEVMDLKIKNKKMSLPDAIGYTVAKRQGVKFLTGDKNFEGFDNVELVKK